MNCTDKIFLASFSFLVVEERYRLKFVLCLPGVYVLHARQESHYGEATKRTPMKLDWISAEGSENAAKCRKIRTKKKIPIIRLPTRRNTNLLF